MSDKHSKFCSHCGSEVQVDDSFCNNCGASLTETIELDSAIPLHQPVGQTSATPYVTDEKPYVKTKMVYGKASLIAGAVALVLSNVLFIRFLCITLCIFSILLGSLAIIRKMEKQGLAIGGIVLSVLAFASYVVSWFFEWWYLIY